MHEPSYVVGLDLGQAVDYTAITVIETPVYIGTEEARFALGAPALGWIPPASIAAPHAAMVRRGAFGPQPDAPPLHVRHLERLRGERYTAIVEHVAALMQRPPLSQHDAILVVDHTGVGRGIVDQFRERLELVAVTITGGSSVNQTADGFTVPKRDLIAAVSVALERGRLKIAETLPAASLLIDELDGFRRRVTKAGNDTYEPWREGQHDDLVLSTALSLWYHRRRTDHMPGFAGRMCPQGHIGCDLPIAACERVAREERAEAAGMQRW